MKTKAIKLIALLIMQSFALLSFAGGDTIRYTVSYDNNKLSLMNCTLDNAIYTEVSYNDLINVGEPGSPSLPIDVITFSVPINAKNFTVSASYSSYKNLVIDYPVIPSQSKVLLRDTKGKLATLLDSSTYYTGDFFPSNKACVVNDGILAGENHVITVAVVPVSCKSILFNPKKYELQIAKAVNISLSYDLDDSMDNCPLISKKRSIRNEGYKLTQKLVVNPESVIDNAPTRLEGTDMYQYYLSHSPMGDRGLFPPYMDDTIETPVNYYTIITPDSLKHSLKRIASFKRQKGYVTTIETVENIINQYLLNNPSVNINDIDSAKVIRQFLKSLFYNGEAGYVLMTGKDVPFKYGWFNTYPTDQYYSDLTADWVSGLYYCPDVYVGRVFARGYKQINNYTDKLLRYELNPGRGDFSYLKRALYTNGYDQFYSNKSSTEIIRTSADSIYTSATVFMENRVNETPTGTQIINEINNTKYGFINFNNHGLPMGIIVYGKGGSEPNNYSWIWAIEGEHAPVSVTYHANDDTSTGNGLNNMVNKYYPSICYSSGCELMPFNISAEYESASMLFGESFTTGKDYGGPAFLGNTYEAGQENILLGKHFFNYINNGFPRIGMAQALSKINLLNEGTKMMFNLLGDPEFELWTDIPQLYSNINISRTNNSITISGIDSDSTIVAYYSNDGAIGTDTISTSSVTLSAISPNCTIMLYKHNYIPYIAPLDLQNITFSNNQYVIASDVNAGYAIDNNRTNGNVVVPVGIEYEIEASGKVTLQDGFKVEKGAVFAVYPSSF